MANIKHKNIAFTSLCMGFFMVILDVTIVNVTLPTIAGYFKTIISNLQWVVAGYTLPFASLLLLIGSLSDFFGAKRVFQVGLIAFSIFSLGCALSFSIFSLIVFRLLQGAAGALLLPPSLALINTIYPDKKEQAKAIGIWAALGGLACASGPFFGGLITTILSWHYVFAVNVIIGLISFILISKSIPESSQKNKNIVIDYQALITSFLTISLLAFSLIEVGRFGWKNTIVISCLITSIIAFIAFIIVESKSINPMIPFSLFRKKTTIMSLIVAFSLNLIFYGSLFALPFYFQNIRHYSVFNTGLALLPLPALAVFGSYLGGKFTAKIGSVLVIFCGLTIAALGYSSLIILNERSPEYIWILFAFLIIGFGVSFTTPAMTFGAIESAIKEQHGIAAGVLNTVNQVGSLIGVAIFGSIIAISKSFITAIHIIFVISTITFIIIATTNLIFCCKTYCNQARKARISS